jgi:hypothetical protein
MDMCATWLTKSKNSTMAPHPALIIPSCTAHPFIINGNPIQNLIVKQPFTIIIADTGIASPTAIAVGDAIWQANPEVYEPLSPIEEITQSASST